MTTSITAATTAAAGAASGVTSTGASTGSAAASLAADQQSFLRLLTTQLRNQDPTQPMDPNAITQQLAQFAAVEQQIAANQHMQSLLSLQQASALVAAAPLVGQSVEVSGNQMVLAGGSSAQQLRLPSQADAGGATRARVTLTNAAGTVVREAVVPLNGTAQSWSWDGKATSGRAAADGTYTVTVAGLDAQGQSRGSIASTIAGTVTGVTRDNGDPRLQIGGLSTALASLRRVN
jgi:flagellar basal-body rod modification protein FlgD